MTGRERIGLLVLVLIACGFIYFGFFYGKGLRSAGEGGALLTQVSARKDSNIHDVRVAKPLANAVRASDDLSDYVCSVAMRKDLCLEDPLSAATESEALWLKQFGYPSRRRLAQLEGMAISELESRSEKGDLTARVVLGKKRIEVKEYTQGRNDIFSALLNGNTYAALEYARSNRPDVPGSTLAEAQAYYRVAYLLGDRKAPREAYVSQQKYGVADAWELVQSDERAMELYRNILKYRGENRVPLRIWPRP